MTRSTHVNAAPAPSPTHTIPGTARVDGSGSTTGTCAADGGAGITDCVAEATVAVTGFVSAIAFVAGTVTGCSDVALAVPVTAFASFTFVAAVTATPFVIGTGAAAVRKFVLAGTAIGSFVPME